MEHIGANLAAPADFFLLAANLSQLLLFFFNLALIELGTKHIHRMLAVLNLRTLCLTGGDDSSRNMCNPNRRLGFVNMLTARTAGTIRINPEVLWANFNFDFIVKLWHHFTRYE